MADRLGTQDWEHKIGRASRELSDEDRQALIRLVKNLDLVDLGIISELNGKSDLLKINEQER